MSKTAIIGLGNVGTHLANEISKKHQISVFTQSTGVNSRHLNKQVLIGSLKEFNPTEFEFIILTVPDVYIQQVGEKIHSPSTVILHTSGSRPITDLNNHQKYGVMYPLQTFSISKTVDFNTFPLFIEGDSEVTTSIISSYASTIDPDVRVMSSKDRLKLHLAAVFMCNFTNHMYHISAQILKELGMSFIELQNLATETLAKAVELSPFKITNRTCNQRRSSNHG